jgi:hypothetical protein
MNDDKKIIEILSDILIEAQGTNKRLDRHEEILAEHSLAIRELPLSIMRLSEVIEKFNTYEDRLRKLETVVFRQAS